MENQTPTGGISGAVLKMIAIVTMAVDHTAVAILERLLESGSAALTTDQYNSYYAMYSTMRCIGRMAFPIFCFLVVEGFLHTSNKFKYAMRMLLFAFLSELPFDLALFHSLYDNDYNNVYYTLFLGLLTLIVIEGFLKKLEELKAAQEAKASQILIGVAEVILVFCIVVGVGIVADTNLHCDYGMAGITAIVIMYLLRSKRLLGFGLGIVALGILSAPLEFFALPMLVPIHLYNGTRGRQIKYFFYAFYPLHLLLLTVICWAIGLPVLY